MLGDVAGGERRIETAQLPDERGARLLIYGAARGPVILGQSLNGLAYELFVIRH
ncbi:MAG: hypothetical protein P4M09_22600 [Devosia sp.]|nr:hypothetical protein [Devosia sp.]